ncbi:MAG: hypothetical protein M1817_001158 [Caeruleum heppii]|nr:MAG: hypothetical protein M1817_001158 [Caeruleum heppii]
MSFIRDYIASTWHEHTAWLNEEPPFRQRMMHDILSIPSTSLHLILPSELIQQVIVFLPPSSTIALRQASWFYYHAEPLEPIKAVYERARKSPTERFELARLLERDERGPFQARRLACCDCKALHPPSWFSEAERSQPSVDRRCRQVRLCPHRKMNFSQYRAARERWKGAKAKNVYHPVESIVGANPLPLEPGVSRYRCCEAVKLYQGIRRWDTRFYDEPMFQSSWTLSPDMITVGLRLTKPDPGDEARFSVLRTKLCPHLTIADVFDRLMERAVSSQQYGIKYSFKWPEDHCLHCASVSSANFHGGEVMVRCDRWFGKAQHPADPSWVAQTS